MADVRRVQPGDPITAAAVNALAERLERFANLSVADGPLRLWSTPTGKALALAVPRDTLARLSGAISPYSWREVLDADDKTYNVHPNANSGVANAYEVNDVAGLDGELVWLTWSAARDWRFQWVGHGAAPPCESGRICVTVDSDGCASSTPVFGAVVTVTDSAEPPNPVDACTTTGRVTALTLTNPGSGYTDGVGYPLTITGDGSGASATFDVVDGQVANLVLTAPGSNYTSATSSFAAAGPGAGAAATATVKGQCCIDVPAPGVYHVKVHVPGAADRSTTINALCNQDNHTSVNYSNEPLATLILHITKCQLNESLNSFTVSNDNSVVASASEQNDNVYRLSLGANASYSYTITTSGGVSFTGNFTAEACTLTERFHSSIGSYHFQILADATESNISCTGIFSLYRGTDDTGELLLSQSISFHPDSGLSPVYSRMFPETATGSLVYYRLDFPSYTFSSSFLLHCTGPLTSDLYDIRANAMGIPSHLELCDEPNQ